MNLHKVYGHEALINRLGGSISSSRFPQTVLFVGPSGVGKQRLALWAARALLCETGEEGACERCPSCRQVGGLVHPDLHWFVPVVPGKRSSDPDKQVQEVAEQIAEVMTERRGQPLYQPLEGRASHSLASVRLLHRRVALKPFQGRRKVVIIGDAERLIVQEGSQEAANALLKVLEEPPADTTIIVTAARPQGLLPTIRSRLIPVRVGAITDTAARQFVESELSLTGRAAERLVTRIEGRPGLAIGANEVAAGADRRAEEFLTAVTKGPAAWSGQALTQQPWDARGGFTALLDALAVRLRRRMVGAATGEEKDLRRYVKALRIVEEHRAIVQGNVNPQAAMAVLAGELERLRS